MSVYHVGSLASHVMVWIRMQLHSSPPPSHLWFYNFFLNIFSSLSSSYLQLHNVQLSPGMSKRETKGARGSNSVQHETSGVGYHSGKCTRFQRTFAIWRAEEEAVFHLCRKEKKWPDGGEEGITASCWTPLWRFSIRGNVNTACN